MSVNLNFSKFVIINYFFWFGKVTRKFLEKKTFFPFFGGKINLFHVGAGFEP